MSEVDQLNELIALNGLKVADVGAGSGQASYRMAALGAQVTGLEIDSAKVEAARLKGAAETSEHEACHGPRPDFRVGRAEALPFEDASLDIVCCFNSIHHVPRDMLDDAVREVRRVLRPGGRLHIVDPMSGGDGSHIGAPIDDETEARDAAQAHIASLPGNGFELITHDIYDRYYTYRDCAEMIDEMVAVDPARLALVDRVRAEVERRFATHGEAVPEGRRFAQPYVRFHLALH